MRIRYPLYLGLAVGYVLGAKAGRERYEQIRRGWAALSKSEKAQQLGAEVKTTASKAGHRLEEKASAGVAKVTSRIKGRHNGDGQHSGQPDLASPFPTTP
ncbi:MAG: YtxH domain-containing protein [Egibacteraceae bacterium]